MMTVIPKDEVEHFWFPKQQLLYDESRKENTIQCVKESKKEIKVR